jgi:hypothetical protein
MASVLGGEATGWPATVVADPVLGAVLGADPPGPLAMAGGMTVNSEPASTSTVPSGMVGFWCSMTAPVRYWSTYNACAKPPGG